MNIRNLAACAVPGALLLANTAFAQLNVSYTEYNNLGVGTYHTVNPYNTFSGSFDATVNNTYASMGGVGYNFTAPAPVYGSTAGGDIILANAAGTEAEAVAFWTQTGPTSTPEGNTFIPTLTYLVLNTQQSLSSIEGAIGWSTPLDSVVEEANNMWTYQPTTAGQAGYITASPETGATPINGFVTTYEFNLDGASGVVIPEASTTGAMFGLGALISLALVARNRQFMAKA